MFRKKISQIVALLIFQNVSMISSNSDMFEPSYDYEREDTHRDFNPPFATRGRRPNLQGRILGGNIAYPGDKPFQLYILYDEFFKCGATLAEENGIQFAITAAHCMWLGYPRQDSTIDKKRIQVVAGDILISHLDGYEDWRNVSRIYQHEQYDPVNLDNDISLLFFDQDFKLDDLIDTVVLPRHDLEIPREIEESGWGAAQTGSKISNHLQMVTVPTLPQHVCQQYSSRTRRITDNQFCAGNMGIGGIGNCNGDSGGPAVIYDPSGSGYQILVGVVSYGVSSMCGHPLYPAVYVRVSKYVDWIKEKVLDYIVTQIG